MNGRVAPPRFVVDIMVAFQFLTRLPIPEVPFAPDGLARSVKYFPLVGLAIGAGAALLQKVLALHLGRPLCALVVLLYLVLMTGCLHEDGLADVADSMGGWNAEQRLTILRDSRIGSYGATVLGLSLAARGVLLATLPLEHFTAYVVSSPCVVPLDYLATQLLPALRKGNRRAGRACRAAYLGNGPGAWFALYLCGHWRLSAQSCHRSHPVRFGSDIPERPLLSP